MFAFTKILDIFKSAYKTKTINGIEYYASGPYSGRRVGSVRKKGEKETSNWKTSLEQHKKAGTLNGQVIQSVKSGAKYIIQSYDKSEKEYVAIEFKDHGTKNPDELGVDESINYKFLGHIDDQGAKEPEKKTVANKKRGESEIITDLKKEKSKEKQLKLFSELHAHYNQKYFDGKLKDVPITFKRNTSATGGGAIGRCWLRKNQDPNNAYATKFSCAKIDYVPRLLNGSEKVIRETVIHEMCHQAVAEIDNKNAGHDYTWGKHMRACGLEPSRFLGKDECAELRTDSENKMVEQKKKEWEARKEEASKQKKAYNNIYENLRSTIGHPVMFMTSAGWRGGFACTFTSRKGGQIAVSDAKQRGAAWWKIKIGDLYEVPDSMCKKILGFDKKDIHDKNEVLASSIKRTRDGVEQKKLFGGKNIIGWLFAEPEDFEIFYDSADSDLSGDELSYYYGIEDTKVKKAIKFFFNLKKAGTVGMKWHCKKNYAMTEEAAREYYEKRVKQSSSADNDSHKGGFPFKKGEHDLYVCASIHPDMIDTTTDKKKLGEYKKLINDKKLNFHGSFVQINPSNDGQPLIALDGNHRIQAAKELKKESVEVIMPKDHFNKIAGVKKSSTFKFNIFKAGIKGMKWRNIKTGKDEIKRPKFYTGEALKIIDAYIEKYPDKSHAIKEVVRCHHNDIDALNEIVHVLATKDASVLHTFEVRY